MKILEPKAIHHLCDGNIEGELVEINKKCFKDIKDIYFNSENVDDNTIMYTVYSYINGDQKNERNLSYGMSVLHPVYINNECNMTRGHYHTDPSFPEIYVGLSGEGFLMLKDKNGNEFAEKVFKGSVHYIDGIYAHRLVNTGDVDLMVQAVWSPCAGHDYDSLIGDGFKYRIFKKDGKIEAINTNELSK